jgi:hypothetical protein
VQHTHSSAVPFQYIVHARGRVKCYTALSVQSKRCMLSHVISVHRVDYFGPAVVFVGHSTLSQITLFSKVSVQDEFL